MSGLPAALETLNTLPIGDVCDLASIPPEFRATFLPRREFGEQSPLTQPRVITEADLEYEPLQKAFSVVRGLLIGLAIELAGFMAIGVYLWAKGLY